MADFFQKKCWAKNIVKSLVRVSEVFHKPLFWTFMPIVVGKNHHCNHCQKLKYIWKLPLIVLIKLDESLFVMLLQKEKLLKITFKCYY